MRLLRNEIRMLRLVARRVPQKVQGIVRLFEVYVPSRIQKDRGFNEINYILIYTRVPIGIKMFKISSLCFRCACTRVLVLTPGVCLFKLNAFSPFC